MRVIIMAGGKGTRIASVNSTIPKPMIPIMDKPILEYIIANVRKQGYTDITLIVGYLGNIIEDYFRNGVDFGVKIQYIREENPLGTAGALYYLQSEIKEDFLLLNGDILFDIDIQRFYEHHKKHGGIATILVHPNSHPYDSGIVVADENSLVTQWINKEEPRGWYQNSVNAGIHIFSSRIFKVLSEMKQLDCPHKLDLDRDVLKQLIPRKELFVYHSCEYVKDMGTPDRYQEVIADLKSGKIAAKNLMKPQKAVFLDRDGTINKYVGFLRNSSEVELMEGVAEAIRYMNKTGYLTIVVTNQPVIARGEVTESELKEIHNKIETLLGKKGAYIDGIYYCPHHPDGGFEGEVAELKKECNCRKPRPGMLLQAAEDFHIDLSRSFMIGDSKSDIEAGKNAGCKTVLITEDNHDYGQDYCAPVLDAATVRDLIDRWEM